MTSSFRLSRRLSRDVVHEYVFFLLLVRMCFPNPFSVPKKSEEARKGTAPSKLEPKLERKSEKTKTAAARGTGEKKLVGRRKSTPGSLSKRKEGGVRLTSKRNLFPKPITAFRGAHHETQPGSPAH